MINLYGPPPDDDHGPFYFDCPSDTYHLDKYMEPCRRVFKGLPLKDIVCLLGIEPHALEKFVAEKRKELGMELLDLLTNYEWEFSETGEAVPVDTEFVQMYLDQDVVCRTVCDRLRDNRHYTIDEIEDMLSFFKEGLIKPRNQQLEL